MLIDRLLRGAVLGVLGVNSIASCSVDHRRLQLGPSYAGFWVIGEGGDGAAAQGGAGADAGAAQGDAGAPGGAGGAPAAGASSGGSNAGSAGTAGAPGLPTLVDGCPDLDLNGKGDCKETLVSNPSFAFDTTAWLAGAGADLAWSPENHFQDSPSGSALVTGVGASDVDGMALSAAAQCVPTLPAARIEAFASAFVKSGQGDGNASLSIFFYPADDCKDPPAGAPVLASSTSTDVWQTVTANQVIPEGTKSLLVRLAVAKPYRTPKFAVLFDNILIKAK